jgi:uncharacterized protein (DUF4415 family)
MYIHLPYEWDEAKRAANVGKHALDFLDCVPLFDGRPVVSVPARTETEARVLTIGWLDDGKFYTVWTWRAEARRIISFRRAGMAKSGRISRYTAEAAVARRRAGTATDWDRVHGQAPEAIEAATAAEDAAEGLVVDWARAEVGLPAPKAVLHMRIDRDVLDFFKRGGRGYQTRINAVLRAYKDAQGPH